MDYACCICAARSLLKRLVVRELCFRLKSEAGDAMEVEMDGELRMEWSLNAVGLLAFLFHRNCLYL